ncbi:conjugal transfer protein TraB [Legionella longbeachae]|uniref:TraB/VirB10 family protein n=1 Tax=Legionella longbeachae TaxID=450 RepID=UPI0009B7BA0A|nr:TraB/VirB10 family protein [Legionella longbeachae]VEE02707.1 putative conjugative transfer protein TraB [Legionella oakridgensis]ARB91030.1 conjugal transfer protein TraB [Legionella longbeachae]ARM32543.1 conjugal transfer protein TraB [Legionella longbeachae]RZV21179.1 conjugal transfer protein TraB [Legionella longbeachae]UAK45770.1 TraB/VirB10 family protein [Legionella longbeachae]
MSIKIKKQQWWALGLISGSLTIVLGGLAYWSSKSSETPSEEKPKYHKHQLASPVSSATREAYWIEKTQNAWKAQVQKSQQVDKHLKNLGDEKNRQQKQIQSQEEQLKELKAIVVALHEEVKTTQEVMRKTKNESPEMTEVQQSSLLAADSGFINYSAKLNQIKKPRVKTSSNYVFSNTFAKAKVLQGADAAAGVLSQANPDVMILQIIDDGVMPNGYRAPLNGCFVSISVVGDISSERGKGRTERLSCIHPNGTIIDTQVTGIVSDSKNGIRGRPVWRDGPMARKAFWGNFWESLGSIGQRYASDYSTSPLGSIETIQAPKIPLAAVSSGGAGAAKMYAQYTIKRAELYHPVIELPPGTIVDVTFLKGFWLDGGTDTQEPAVQASREAPSVNEPVVSSEERAAQQFFNQNHSF